MIAQYECMCIEPVDFTAIDDVPIEYAHGADALGRPSLYLLLHNKHRGIPKWLLFVMQECVVITRDALCIAVHAMTTSCCTHRFTGSSGPAWPLQQQFKNAWRR